MEDKDGKIQRILSIYTMLINGHTVNKAELADRFHVNERSIQRDIDDIRSYLDKEAKETGIENYVSYDREAKGYRIDTLYRMKFTNQEVLALAKILLDSRAFTKSEMTDMLKRLIQCCVPQSNQKLVNDLIMNEAFHYIEPRHKSEFLDTMWQLGQAIYNSQFIEIEYQRLKEKKTVNRKLKPLAIMFNEFYFYFVGFIDDEEVRKDFDVLNDSFPTIYRIDRIKKLKILNEKFHIPYSSRFQEGEFRKRIQFMYGGKLRRVKFKYTGLSVEAVLDRLPTARIVDEVEGAYIIEAEVFGDGIDMWIRSQGDKIEILER